MSKKDTTVCVTGATGFIGAFVVKELLAAGYTVRAAVRTLDDKEKNQHLEEWKKENDALSLVVIPDIQKKDGFPEAFKGCTYVMHVASPVFINSKNEEDFVKPAVEGTRLVLQQALDAKVKRVVITSSIASICGTQRSKDPDHVWSEEDHNDEMGSPYSKSKTMAEKAAWDFAKEKGIEIVTIHPSLVLGPYILNRVSSSVNVILPLINGEKAEEGAPVSKFGLCDIRNVVEAHIKAMETPEAKGHRYLVSDPNQYATMEIVEVIKKHFPDLKVPSKYVDGKKHISIKNFADNDRVCKLLGVERLIPAEKSIIDFVQGIVDSGLIKKKDE